MKYVTIKKIAKDLEMRYGIVEQNLETLSEYTLTFYAHFNNLLMPNDVSCCIDSMENCELTVELPCNTLKVLEVVSSKYGRLIEGDTSCLHGGCHKVYSITNDGFIKTNVDEGKISYRYSYIPMDNDGFIKIPDEPLLINALVSYIAYYKMPVMVIKKQIDTNQFKILDLMYRQDMNKFAFWLKRVKRGDHEKMAAVTNTYLKPMHQYKKEGGVWYINDGHDFLHFQTKN